MRLDEILMECGSAAPAQIQEALEYQQTYGGRLETHLLRFGYIGENNLVNALSRQFQCEGISLAGRDIPPDVLNLIPAPIARAYLVLPFAFDRDSNTLHVACENPRDDHLRDILHQIVTERELRLHVAVGVILKCAIVNHYRTMAISPEKEPFCQIETAVPEQNRPKPEMTCRVLAVSIDGPSLDLFQHETAEYGYQLTAADNLDRFDDLYRQSRPDLLVIMHGGTNTDINAFIDNLILRDVYIDQIPTFLLVKADVVPNLNALLKDGIEDVLPLDDCFWPLIIKMNRVRDRIEAVSRQRRTVIRELGTHGTLEDMNVIDLLQMMGPSRKTARISITGHGRHLTIFLNCGSIIYAECDGKTGAEAVYQGLSWNYGIWSVDPITEDDLPEPNNDLPNESILLEGCRLLDEQSRQEDSPTNLRW
ncbi:MAG: DUF4388 domain-containing protein [candidate division Zixibacteria bacterium]|nr:DUF4388 domain-containing protein [candidate division Zixibacteria bacterium]